MGKWRLRSLNKMERKIINEKETVLNSYKTGKTVSKKYNKKEIEEKKQFYLALKPEKTSGISINRWHYEIKRVFELNQDFEKCPDMWFYHLDTFRKYGM